MNDVGIVDYGMGNLRSIEEALRSRGYSSRRVSRPQDCQAVRAIVVPGVGGFPEAMSTLRSSGMADLLIRWHEHGNRLVGICLGMQILFEGSFEFEQTGGLSLFSGWLNQLERRSPTANCSRVPNVGWRPLAAANELLKPGNKRRPYNLIGSNSEIWMYFAHSFGVSKFEESQVIATVNHNETHYAAIATCGLTTAFQGHPELSGTSGLNLLEWALNRD